MRALIFPCVFTLSTAFFPQPAVAFKVDTHVWIAQQVINELAKNPTIHFVIGKTTKDVPIPVSVRDAILANQEAFRMGSVGPDAFPGVYEGQMTIHPGAAGNKKVGWGTGEWLTHVLSKAQTPEEIAFAYGMLTHAAADIFAHTYVNQYAGDVYYLTDGEIEVEARHFLMEGYIAQKMPGLVGSDGQPIVSISGSLRKNGQLAIPTGFLWRVFVDDATASRQFNANGSPHMTAIYDLNRSLISLSRSGGPLEKLHELSQQVMSHWYLGQNIDSEKLTKLNEFHEQFNNATNTEISRLQDNHNKFVDFSKNILGSTHKAERDALAKAQQILDKLDKARQELNKAELELADAVDKLNELKDAINEKVVDECKYIANQACFTVGHPIGCGGDFTPCLTYTQEPPGCGGVSLICEPVKKVTTIENSLRPEARKLVEAKQEIENKARIDVNRLLVEYKSFMESVWKAEKGMIDAHQAVFNASVDMIKRTRLAADPITGLARAWVADINQSMSAYFVANGTAMANSMDEGDVLQPLRQWVDCSAPAILGIQSPILDATCSAKATIKEIREALDAILFLAKYSDPILREIIKIKGQIDKAIAIAERDALVTIATKVTGVEVMRLLALINSKPNKTMIDDQFARAPSNKDLIVFEKLSDRLDAEMHLDASGKYRLDEFPPLHNAIVLAKLALLDATALNTIIGRKIFTKAPLEHSNVILRFASSIDGNHQWLQQPPPYPRSTGKHEPAIPYGYKPCFALWSDSKMRKTIFNGLFKGPLSPGLETPSALGLTAALPKSYPYRPTAKDPYPLFGGSCLKK